MALDSLFTGPGRTALEPGELLVEIEVPAPRPNASGAYEKFSLRRMDLAVVGAAAMLELEGDVCHKAKIVLSAVAPTAIRVHEAETMLEGRALEQHLIHAAAQAAASQADPKADLQGTVQYKRNAAAALVARVIRRALERAGKKELS